MPTPANEPQPVSRPAFDYSTYGAFKGTDTATQGGSVRRFLQRLGLGNRYLRFLAKASRTLPLVEIGCGDGAFLVVLSRAGFQSLRGVEPSPSYRQVAPAGSIVHCFAGEYLSKIPSASIGTVVALDVFEHIPLDDLRELLTLVADRLVPGGLLMFRVPNMAGALGLYNFYGDFSHTTALNEVSLRQLAFGTSFTQVEIQAEPLAYPRTVLGLAGVLVWLPYRFLNAAVLAAFGIRARILTPNIVCTMTKSSELRRQVEE
jgi:SAM-dependent methyltransferase